MCHSYAGAPAARATRAELSSANAAMLLAVCSATAEWRSYAGAPATHSVCSAPPDEVVISLLRFRQNRLC
jgi:hypothetical protein